MTAGWVEAARTRLDAASFDGDAWDIRFADEDEPFDASTAFPSIDGVGPFHGVWYNTSTAGLGAETGADLLFLAAAPTDLRRALDALDAVLALHRPMEGGKGLVYCCVCVDDSYDEIPWPCPTVRAIDGTEDA